MVSVSPDLGLLPLCTGLLLVMSIITTYVIAVSLGHVDLFLPAISDTGIYHPEMHFFSQFLNIVAAMSIATFVVRYKAVQCVLGNEDVSLFRHHRRACLVLGILASMGLSIVGNFQDNTAIIGHTIGALLVFLLGNIYILIDAALTYRLHPKYSGRVIFWIRLVIGIVGLSAFVPFLVCTKLSDKASKQQALHWKPWQEGYAIHLSSTISEWVMGLAFISYFFTYIKEFRKFDLELKVTQLEEHEQGGALREIPTERSPLLP